MKRTRQQKEVLNFIHEFFDIAEKYGIESESLRLLFRAGYCFYFASMLKDGFSRGELYVTAPYGHVIWKDTDECYYDIEGMYFPSDHNVTLIPMTEPLLHEGADFKHIPTPYRGATEEEIKIMIDKYSGKN